MTCYIRRHTQGVIVKVDVKRYPIACTSGAKKINKLEGENYENEFGKL